MYSDFLQRKKTECKNEVSCFLGLRGCRKSLNLPAKHAPPAAAIPLKGDEFGFHDEFIVGLRIIPAFAGEEGREKMFYLTIYRVLRHSSLCRNQEIPYCTICDDQELWLKGLLMSRLKMRGQAD